MLLFSAEKTEFLFFVFPYFRVLPSFLNSAFSLLDQLSPDERVVLKREFLPLFFQIRVYVNGNEVYSGGDPEKSQTRDDAAAYMYYLAKYAFIFSQSKHMETMLSGGDCSCCASETGNPGQGKKIDLMCFEHLCHGFPACIPHVLPINPSATHRTLPPICPPPSRHFRSTREFNVHRSHLLAMRCSILAWFWF